MGHGTTVFGYIITDAPKPPEMAAITTLSISIIRFFQLIFIGLS